MGNTASLDSSRKAMQGRHQHHHQAVTTPCSHEAHDAKPQGSMIDDAAPSSPSSTAEPSMPSIGATAATQASGCKQRNPAATPATIRPHHTATATNNAEQAHTATASCEAASTRMELQQAAEQSHAPTQQWQQHVSDNEQAMTSTPVAQRWPATAQQHLRAQAGADSSTNTNPKAAFNSVGGQAPATQPAVMTSVSSSNAAQTNGIGSSTVAAGTATKAARSVHDSASEPSASKPVLAAAASDAASGLAARLAPLGMRGPKDNRAPAQPLVPVQLCTSPRMLLVDEFLDEATCHQLIRMADPLMTRSRVATGLETPSRTSSSCFFVKEAAKHPVIEQLEDDIMKLFTDPGIMQGRPALERAEALQVVRYHVGEFYYEHYDNKAGDRPTRDATIIIYLWDTEDGGATHFPKATLHPRYVKYSGADDSSEPLPCNVKADPFGQGVHIGPLMGRALLFWSCHPDGKEDVDSLHASLAVRKGKKYIATRWLRRTAEAEDTSIKPELRHHLEPDH